MEKTFRIKTFGLPMGESTKDDIGNNTIRYIVLKEQDND